MLHTDADRDSVIEASKNGLCAVFLYCNKLLSGGESVFYNSSDRSLRSIGKDSKIYTPSVFFTKTLGAVLGEDGRLTLDERSSCTEPIRKDGVDYFLMPETAIELGLDARLYYDKRLVVIATPEQHEWILRGGEAIEEAVSYAVFGKYDASVFTSEDYGAAKEEWRLRVIGSPEINLSHQSSIPCFATNASISAVPGTQEKTPW